MSISVFLLLNISIGSKPKYPDRPGSTCDPVWVETAAFQTFLKAMNKLSFLRCSMLIYIFKNTEKDDNMESSRSDLHVTLFITNIVNAGIF